MIKIQERYGQLVPLIGSGTIKRRIDVRKIHKKKIFDSIKLQRRMEIKKKIKLKKINFINEKTKLIFLHWNSKGTPFTTHKLVETVTVSTGINKAHKASKKYSFRNIRDAIDLCHDTFNAPWFKFRTDKVGIGHLSLANFFKYNDEKIKEIRAHYKQLADAEVKSWFQECLKGENYLREKYSFRFKDENKRLTKFLKKIWLTYSQDRLSPNDKNALTICSKKTVEFARLNERLGVSAEGVIMIIDNMINKFGLYKPKHIGYLLTDHFWNREIPRELVRYGTVSNIDQSKIQLLPWDKK